MKIITLLKLLFFILCSNIAFAVHVLSINTAAITSSTIRVGDCLHHCDFFCSVLNESDLTPISESFFDGMDQLIIKVDGEEISLSEEMKARLVLFFKKTLEQKRAIDCSRFCSNLHGFDSNVEEQDCFDLKLVRDHHKPMVVGDVVTVGTVSEDQYESRHYAIYLAPNIFLSKFGNYPGLGITTLMTLINLYTQPHETLRLYRYTK